MTAGRVLESERPVEAGGQGAEGEDRACRQRLAKMAKKRSCKAFPALEATILSSW